MTTIAHQRFQVLFALFLEFHLDPYTYHDLDDINERYKLKIEHNILHSLLTEWEKIGVLEVSRSFGSMTSASINRLEYGKLIEIIQDRLSAKTISVFPNNHEILSDVRPPRDIPMLEGWKWLTFAEEEASDPGLITDSSIWTGRYEVSHDDIIKVQHAIELIDQSIDKSDLSNTQKSNAKALIGAIHKLIESPDPEWGLILTILSSPILANFAAIAALIVTIVKS